MVMVLWVLSVQLSFFASLKIADHRFEVETSKPSHSKDIEPFGSHHTDISGLSEGGLGLFSNACSLNVWNHEHEIMFVFSFVRSLLDFYQV